METVLVVEVKLQFGGEVGRDEVVQGLKHEFQAVQVEARPEGVAGGR